MDSDNLDYFSMFITTADCISSPVAAINSPTDGSLFCANAAITITATVNESTSNPGSSVPACNGKTITSVAFYDGSNLLGTVTSPNSTYTYIWVSPPRGIHKDHRPGRR